MKTRAVRPSQLIVVDQKLDDYTFLLAESKRHELRIKMFQSGEDALQAATRLQSPAWLVNVRLSDMTGIHLLCLVRRRRRRAIVVLVGDQYSAAEELDARAAGATAYICKPADAAWLQIVRPRHDSRAIRAGPLPRPGAEFQ